MWGSGGHCESRTLNPKPKECTTGRVVCVRVCVWSRGPADVPQCPQLSWAGPWSWRHLSIPWLTWLWQRLRRQGPGGKRWPVRRGRGRSAAGPWWAARGQWLAAGQNRGKGAAGTEARAPEQAEDSDVPGEARVAARQAEPRHSVPWRPGGGTARPPPRSEKTLTTRLFTSASLA
jgi:hypothetical protein